VGDIIKLSFEEIVHVQAIGEKENPFNLNELLIKAAQETLDPAHLDQERNIVVAIDIQLDFMEKGALGVPGSHQDVENFLRFIYKNFSKISKFKASIDTHLPEQIFFPSWWKNKNGHHPEPLTAITWEDIQNEVWHPLHPNESAEYVYNLKLIGRPELMIWNYHCIQGTSGCALENQFANMLFYHAAARKVTPDLLVKGQDPFTEMYGVFKPEYDPTKTYPVTDLDMLQDYDKIIFAGQAKSHCVATSIEQVAEHYKDRPDVTSKIYILEDCMSNIPGFEQATANRFNEFKTRYKMNILKSTALVL
jgi:nicotinamidase-related amidase